MNKAKKKVITIKSKKATHPAGSRKGRFARVSPRSKVQNFVDDFYTKHGPMMSKLAHE